MYKFSRITNSTESNNSLSIIFNAENEVACANYGGGTHCNDEKVATKLRVWGGRNVEEGSCARPSFIFNEEEEAGIFVIGFSGNPATVLDRSQNKVGSVYELSGLFLRDAFINELEDIAPAVISFMSDCKAEEGYTKAIVAFSPSHPYQEDVLSTAGAFKVTEDNIESILGINSLHPERFQFFEGQLQICSKWAEQGSEKVQHEAWHDSEACVSWNDTTMLVFEVSGQNIVVFDEL